MANSPASKIILVLAGCMLMACGKQESVRSSTAPQPPAVAPGAPSPGPGPGPGPSSAASANVSNTQKAAATSALVPIETVLLGPTIPSRLAATSLSLNFTSNADDAVYECRMTRTASWRRDCLTGATLELRDLAEGKAYSFEVRAVNGQGLADQTPLTIAFLVDRAQGSPRVAEDDAGRSSTSQEQDAASLSKGMAKLALGGALQLVLPYQHQLVAYATNQTTNARHQVYRSMAVPFYAAPGCDGAFDKLIILDDGRRFCSSTPPVGEPVGDVGWLVHGNMVETYAPGGQGASERLLLRVIDGEDGLAVRPMALETQLCRGSQRGGLLPISFSFRGASPGAVGTELSWCLGEDGEGHSVYVGSFRTPLLTDGGHIELMVSYSVRGQSYGILSSTDLVGRLAALLSQALLPVR